MKKYVAGHRIASIDELLRNDLVVIGHKVYHQGWFASWQLRSIALLIKNGAIYTAERRKELPKKLYIPFSNEGNMLSYSRYDMTPEQEQIADERGEYILDMGYGSIRFVPNYEFTDTLKYHGYSRGCSSAKIRFLRMSCSTTVEMFLTDFDDMMESAGFDGQCIRGKFTFVKRGLNYGVKYLGRADE